VRVLHKVNTKIEKWVGGVFLLRALHNKVQNENIVNSGDIVYKFVKGIVSRDGVSTEALGV
jgi:hypothetical protein